MCILIKPHEFQHDYFLMYVSLFCMCLYLFYKANMEVKFSVQWRWYSIVNMSPIFFFLYVPFSPVALFQYWCMTVELNDSQRDHSQAHILAVCYWINHPCIFLHEMVQTSEMYEFILDLILSLASFMTKKYQRRPWNFLCWELSQAMISMYTWVLVKFWQHPLAEALMEWAWPSWMSPDPKCANRKHPCSILGGVTWTGEVSSHSQLCQEIWHHIGLSSKRESSCFRLSSVSCACCGMTNNSKEILQ